MSELALQIIRENIEKHERGEDATTLDLGNCGLTEVPEEIGLCVWLEELNFASEWVHTEGKLIHEYKTQNTGELNNIFRLPASISRLKTLKKLQISGHKNQKFDFSDLSKISDLTNLQELGFWQTLVSDLSPLSGLLNLKELSFSNTLVSDLSLLAGLTKLQMIECWATQISDLSPLAGLTNLQQLYCAETQVADLSPLAGLTSLQELNCSKTQIADLSPLVGLASLQMLSCYTTQVNDLAPLAGLTNLQELYCVETQITDLSPLTGLTNLRMLNCARTKVTELSALGGLTILQEIECYATQIADLSPLSGLTNLQKLDCDSTQVADLSPLSGLTNLQKLSCNSTQVADLSPLVGLTNLQQLSCDSTQVADLSPLVGLTNLQKLSCDSTQVADLSPLVGLTNLQKLSCGYTQVADLSPLAGLTNLQKLSCRKTQVSNLSQLDWKLFQKLVRLDISKSLTNDLLPVKPLIERGLVVKWDYLEDGICIQDCPLTNPPVEVVKQGNEAILHYFEDLQTQGEEIVYEAKMLILGDAGAGKTTLARKVENPDAVMPHPENDSTPGIAVRSIVLTDKKPDFTMHLWDFGGQEVYHATHQFFLSKRSLYILLSDGRKEEQLDYWLQMQEIYGQDSRLLLVVNQKGEMQPNLPMGDIRRDYPNVQQANPTILNLKTDRLGVVTLRQRIENSIRNLPQFEQGLRTPKKWAALRRQLESLGVDHISLSDYRKMCADEGITDRFRQDELLDFLHNLGALLHFREVAGLNKMVILRPSWATDAVYRLLDHTKKKGDNGHFARRDLDLVWQCAEYEDYFEELLLLMDRFELCYPAPENKTVFIVPSLLPDDRPKGSDWAVETGEMQLWYEYSFMPKGIVTRLIVRQHHLLETPPTVWKRGAIFAIENARAEVSESFREKRISIRASGKQAKSLLTTLAREIDALNNGFHFNERMTLKQIVPCNCLRCKTAAKPHPFDFKTLANRLERGRIEIDCEVSLEPISIPDLLRETFSDADLILKNFERRGEKRRSGGRIPAGKMQRGGDFDQSDFGEKSRPAALKIFISYSKHDREDFLIPMTRYLKPLMLGGLLETWDDSQILPGEEWDEKIKSEIEKADVIFLLISTNSLNTEYIWNVEIEAAMRRHEAGTAYVIPIILSKCLWTEKDQVSKYIFPPAKLNALPAKGKPIDEWERENHAWDAVAEGVKAILKEMN